jgi:hypothetical protein
LPCSSITLFSGTPEAWCSPSMFWVITAATLPSRTSRATARWPRFGSAARSTGSEANLRRHASRRISREAMKSWK